MATWYCPGCGQNWDESEYPSSEGCPCGCDSGGSGDSGDSGSSSSALNVVLANIKIVKYTSLSQNLNAVEPNIVNFDSVATWAKPFTLSVPALPTGVASCTVTRSSTKATLGSTGTLATAGSSVKTATIYYGDVISIAGTAATGFNNPTVSLSATTVTGNVTASISRGSAKSYTLTVPALPTGIASCTVSRTSSPYGGASTGTIISAGSSQKTATIYYGDVLSITASATTGYNTPTYKLSATTVTGNVTATLTAGSLKTFTVSFAVNTSGYGTVSKSSIASVPYGSSISVSGGTVTINGTAVTATATTDTAQYDYAFSSWSNTSGTITAARTITANFTRTVRSYKISVGAKPTGVATFVVYKNSTAVVSNPTAATSFTANYGDTIYATTTAATGYNSPTLSNITTSATSVTGAKTVSVIAGSVKSFTLTITKPTGVSAVTVNRTSSPYKGASTGALSTSYTTETVYECSGCGCGTFTASGTCPVCGSPLYATSISNTNELVATVYYGDVLTASATASTGYNTPTLSWTSKTITASTTLTTTAGSIKSYTLSYPAKPTGVYAYTISRTSSPYKGASTGVIVSSPSSSGSVTVYYGDVLSISASASSYYSSPTAKLSTTTVTGNVTATVTAGSYSEPSNQCVCGEYGYHYCPCYGEYVDPDEDSSSSGGTGGDSSSDNDTCPYCGAPVENGSCTGCGCF